MTKSDRYMGEIVALPYLPVHGGLTVNHGLLPCDGQLLGINQYPLLYGMLGTRYGGDGRRSFALPNMNGRTPVCIAFNDPESETGTRGGVRDVEMTDKNLPQHSHTANTRFQAFQRATTQAGDSATPQQGSLPATLKNQGDEDIAIYLPIAAANKVKLAAPHVAPDAGIPVTTEGHGQKMQNLQPFLGIAYYIVVDGLFPPPSG